MVPNVIRMVHINEVTAEAVRTAYKNAGATIASLSEETGIPGTTLKRRLNGSTSFHLDELVRIAKALDVTLGALIPEEALAIRPAA